MPPLWLAQAAPPSVHPLRALQRERNHFDGRIGGAPRLGVITMHSDKKIKQIIADQLGIPEEEILNESSFVEDLGADSLDIVELIMAMEEEFEIEISDEDAEKLLTVQDTLDYIKKNAQ